MSVASGAGAEYDGFSVIVEFLAKDPRKRTGMKVSRSFQVSSLAEDASKEGQCSDTKVVEELINRRPQVSAPVILGLRS